ncbi:MAG: DUF642 domain-containing protein, partial [Anaerolineae bacterium]|nr:DUF642 domain-containing protein [Anaerolineae bacterium]
YYGLRELQSDRYRRQVDWLGAGSGLTAAHGARSIDVASAAAGGIRQSFATSPGTRYTVRFAMSGNTSQDPSQKDMTVSAGDSTETFSFAGPANEWEYKSMTFTATDETTTLTFTSLVDGIYGPELDDVRVQAGEQVVVPEPETTSATGTGCIVDVFKANELSDAINAANAGTGCPTIRLNEDIPLGRLIPPYTNEFGDNAFPIITSSIVIEGSGYTISRVNAESDFRFFFVSGRDGNQGNLTLNDLTLSGGNVLDGGAIFVDASNGGIAALTINHSTFADNTAAGNGGAIATLSMNGGTVTTTITDSSFTGNVGLYGAAFYNGGFDGGNATATITNTVFDGNRTDNEGGAIYNNGLGSNGLATLNLSGSTFNNNSALRGGAIFNNGSRGGRATVHFDTTSFTLNTAGAGDAIYSNGVDGLTDVIGDVGGAVVGAGGNTTQCFSDDSGVVVVLDACEAG